MSDVYCEYCESSDVVRDVQEPYGDGDYFTTVQCRDCGFGKIVRDDLCPEYEGGVFCKPRPEWTEEDRELERRMRLLLGYRPL